MTQTARPATRRRIAASGDARRRHDRFFAPLAHVAPGASIMIKVCVLTVSDRCSQGLAEDASGRTLKELISGNNQLSLSRYAIVPDDEDRIKVRGVL